MGAAGERGPTWPSSTTRAGEIGLLLQHQLGFRGLVRVVDVFPGGVGSALVQGQGSTWARERKREGQLLSKSDPPTSTTSDACISLNVPPETQEQGQTLPGGVRR